eukprot:g28036.t1
MRIPSLVERMRQLLQEVCRAYLSNYMELHPNLQVLLELWPEDERELNAWVRSLSQDGSATWGSLHFGLARTCSIQMQVPQCQWNSSPKRLKIYVMSLLLRRTVHVLPLKSRHKHWLKQRPCEKNSVMQNFCRRRWKPKWISFRIDVRKYWPRGFALGIALATSPTFLSLKVLRQAAKGDGSSRKGKKLDSQNSTDVVPAAEAVKAWILDHTTDESESFLCEVEELQKAFEEPLKVLFSQYAKPRRGAGGKRLEMRLEVMESMLEDLEISPSRLQKKAVSQLSLHPVILCVSTLGQVPQLFKSGLPKPADEALLVENFLQLVPRLAKCFSASEATPMRDFGVTVSSSK